MTTNATRGRRDRHYMGLALRLARRGYGTTSPNPMVGAVLVKEGLGGLSRLGTLGGVLSMVKLASLSS